ncbi:hypothetical protein [Methanogenium cariaci]|uniref:hypothetical protein n=1 Tax=Methanogenium cariaci TaxID=2197 RepID=UPI0007822076|nr:hypothetical protein [Methanogenium cariaci]
MKRSFKRGNMMVNDHDLIREVRDAGTKITQNGGITAADVTGRDARKNTQPYLDVLTDEA